MIFLKDRSRRRNYGSIMRYVIHGFIEAMIYCSNELYHKEREESKEKSSLVEDEKEEEDDESNVSNDFTALEIVRKIYIKLLELATICN